jgi:hypothetical protein
MTGDAFTFMSPEEATDLAAIERAIQKRLPRITVPGFDYASAPAERFEVPIAERIAAIRARKAQERQRAREKAERRVAHEQEERRRVVEKAQRRFSNAPTQRRDPNAPMDSRGPADRDRSRDPQTSAVRVQEQRRQHAAMPAPAHHRRDKGPSTPGAVRFGRRGR